MVLKMDEPPQIRQLCLGESLEEQSGRSGLWQATQHSPTSRKARLPLPQGYAWQSRLLLETGRGLARVVVVPQ